MSQRTSLLYSLLSKPLVYNLVQFVLGGRNNHKWFVTTHVRPFSQCNILDIGCGTGEIVRHFPPDITYYGFDENEEYIQRATAVYGNKATFTRGIVGKDCAVEPEIFDIAIAHGILHHLNDEEVNTLFEIAFSALKPGGRLVTLDGCFIAGQNLLAKFIISADRGKYVRSPEAYTGIAQRTFASCTGYIKHNMWVPYTYWIMECQK